MTIVSRGLALALALLLPGAAAAQDTFGWVQGLHSRVRLVAAGRDGGAHLAGIDIALDHGFKTYWRTPGESGLPPRFDWSGSTNAASIEVLWPAPRRYEDAGGVAYVYGGRVVLPVRVRATDPGRPVALRLSVDYGVCKEICIPARADVAATLDGNPADPSLRKLVEAYGLSRLPKPIPVGAPEPLSVQSVAEAPADGKPGYRVTVRGPGNATLFAEGPQDWYVSTSAPAGDGRFTVRVDEKPKGAKGPATLLLTLVAGDAAVETELHLDEALRPR